MGQTQLWSQVEIAQTLSNLSLSFLTCEGGAVTLPSSKLALNCYGKSTVRY